jgi:2-hydroxy-3-keto-5-methylthiopentenyl-1-phosphate phosphatase
MEPIIRSILNNLLGEEAATKIDIIANGVNIKPDGHFDIVYRHPESPFGHDVRALKSLVDSSCARRQKSKALRPYTDLPADRRPTVFFAGDGVSDASAAGESDILFVKVRPDKGNDLMKHCKREAIPFVPFHDFSDVVRSPCLS